MGGIAAAAEKATNRMFLTKAFAVLVLGALIFSSEGWNYRNILIEESLFFAGLFLVALCLMGRAWGLSYISGSKNRRLITSGPYSLCRNPLYFSNLLGAVGLALCTETITITLVVIAVFVLYYPRVIDKEEKRLRELFGEEFETYCQRVPRLFPRFKGFTEDENVLISARAFRRGVLDLGALVMAVGLIELVEVLHKANILPSLFVLY